MTLTFASRGRYGEHAVGFGGPGEGTWVLVVLGEVMVDGGLQVDDCAEHRRLSRRGFAQIRQVALGVLTVQPRASTRRRRPR